MSAPESVDLALGPEWAALELLCTGAAERDPAGWAKLLAAADLRWGELLEQALRHQLLPMLALRALRAEETAGARIPGRIANHLLEVLEANRWHLRLLRREAARVAAALRARGVRFVATKGITLESTLYRGEGVRTLKDIDFMIAPGDRAAVAETLVALGFQPGVYDRASHSIVPHPRRQQMVYAMNPDHLPRHARVLDEPCFPFVYVDIANSLTWHNSPFEVPIDEALAGAGELPLPGLEPATLPCFAPEHQFLFTVLHLFREAWFEQWIEYEIDVSLMKFGDVIRLFEAHADALCSGRFTALLDRHRVAEPVAWVLEHTDRTFGTAMAARLGLRDRVDEAKLKGAHPSYGKERTWRGTMRERLWAKDRRTLFERLEARA